MSVLSMHRTRLAEDAPPFRQQHGADLASLAAFTMDAGGRVASWSVTAERLFGHPARAVVGRDVCDLLLTGPGQRQLVRDALAEVAAGRTWTETLSMALPGGPVAIRCEPLAGPGTAVLVIAQLTPAQPGPGWLSEAAAWNGTTLDLSQTAEEIVDVVVPDRERRAAVALQHGLLPGQPQVPAGMEVASRCLPAGASVVGGDWHDIVPLSAGRAALIVGDAMGHGPEAAAAMVQLRTAAHLLAGLNLAPEEVLRRLDQMAASLAAPFATCISTVIDPAGRSCLIAQAGHHPPVLVLPGGATRVLELPPGLPLGLGAESFDATRISLPPGATLALYTDGLVEGRARPIDDGLAALRDVLSSALASPQATLDVACQAITQELRQHGEDDITLVLARISQ